MVTQSGHLAISLLPPFCPLAAKELRAIRCHIYLLYDIIWMKMIFIVQFKHSSPVSRLLPQCCRDQVIELLPQKVSRLGAHFWKISKLVK